MSDFLSPATLRDLTGSPQRARQIKWLQENAWLFSIDRYGYPKVSQAYFDRRLVGVATPEPKGETTPDWAAAGM